VSEHGHVPDNARGALRSSRYWEYRGAHAMRFCDGWWDAYDNRPMPPAPDPDGPYVAGRREYAQVFAPGARRMSEPLLVCGEPMEHVAGFVWAGSARGLYVRFHADAAGTSVALVRETASGPPLHEARAATHYEAAALMTAWIEEKYGAPRGVAGVAAAAAEGTSAMQLIDRPLAELREHPLNPRSKTPETVAEMVASLQRPGGLLQPLVIKPDGTILSGHRRFWGAQELAWDTIPCHVVDGESEAVALEILLISNQHIARPDAMKEADAVAELLKSPGWNVPAVADALGRPARWVARRAQLRNLAPKLQERIRAGKLWAEWPVEWLERIAVLAKGAQEEFAKRWDQAEWQRPVIRKAEDLDELLAQELHLLGKAPFDIHDAELVPKAGACVSKIPGGQSCTKTSIARPGLFDDQVEGDVATARCCDALCWKTKVAAHVKAQLERAKAEHGDVVVVQPDGAGGRNGSEGLQAIDKLQVNSLPAYQVERTKGSVRGAKAAVFVQPDGSTKTGFVATGAAAVAARRGEKPKPTADEKTPAQKLKDSKEAIKRRRWAEVVDTVREHVEDEKLLAPAHEEVLALLLLYECPISYDMRRGAGLTAEEAPDVVEDFREWDREIWARLREPIAKHLNRSGMSSLDKQHARALWLAPRIGFTVEELEAKALEEVPDPKWWGAAKPAKRAKAKRAGRDPVPEDETPEENRERVDRSLRQAGVTDSKLVPPAPKKVLSQIAKQGAQLTAWVDGAAAMRLETTLEERDYFPQGPGKPHVSHPAIAEVTGHSVTAHVHYMPGSHSAFGGGDCWVRVIVSEAGKSLSGFAHGDFGDVTSAIEFADEWLNKSADEIAAAVKASKKAAEPASRKRKKAKA